MLGRDDLRPLTAALTSRSASMSRPVAKQDLLFVLLLAASMSRPVAGEGRLVFHY